MEDRLSLLHGKETTNLFFMGKKQWIQTFVWENHRAFPDVRRSIIILSPIVVVAVAKYCFRILVYLVQTILIGYTPFFT